MSNSALSQMWTACSMYWSGQILNKDIVKLLEFEETLAQRLIFHPFAYSFGYSPFDAISVNVINGH